MSELADAATVLVLVLAYLLILQALTAAAVLLAQFIVWRVRALRSVLGDIKSASSPEVQPQTAGESRRYRLGGYIRW
jgi:hypothetical protein